MRISDWSSDVCASDLASFRATGRGGNGCGVRSFASHGLEPPKSSPRLFRQDHVMSSSVPLTKLPPFTLLSEPGLSFSPSDTTHVDVHPLRGLANFGPSFGRQS